VAPEYLRH